MGIHAIEYTGELRHWICKIYIGNRIQTITRKYKPAIGIVWKNVLPEKYEIQQYICHVGASQDKNKYLQNQTFNSIRSIMLTITYTSTWYQGYINIRIHCLVMLQCDLDMFILEMFTLAFMESCKYPSGRKFHVKKRTVMCM